MTIQTIDIDKIDATGRLRPTRPDWVTAFAEQIAAGETLPPIEVAARPDGTYRLITGAHRLAAHAEVGRTTINADVKDADAYADEAACRLREIAENMYRVALTELDRAVALTEWKRIYEAANPLPKRGRPSAEEIAAESAGVFSASFSVAAAQALGISERSVRVAVMIATGLDPTVRERIALHPIADHQSELMALSREPAARQAKIVDLLLAEEARIDTVAIAIATLDKLPAPRRAAPWERVSDRFARLKEKHQHAFFEAHFDSITMWLTKRAAGASADKR